MNLRHVALAGVAFSLLTLGAAPARADGPTDITSFISCLNNIAAPQTVAAAVACVPSPGCYVTLTLSAESPQTGCTLADGTRLPRVIFSCPGNGTALRFRPSFTLCTQGRQPALNHVEVGEDLNAVVDRQRVQKMAAVETARTPWQFTEFTAGTTAEQLEAAVVDAPAVVATGQVSNNKGCFDCHDRMGTGIATGGTFNRFAPVRPEVAEGTIFTNDPRVAAPAGQGSLSDTFTAICNGISNSTLLARNLGRQWLASSLCTALAAKSNQ